MENTVISICVYMAAGMGCFFLGHAFFRKPKEFAVWKLVVYLVVIAFPSLFISNISTDLTHNFFIVRDNFVVWPGFHVDAQTFLFICAFIMFVSLNFVLWRILVHATVRTAFRFSLILGLFNAVVCLTTAPIFK